MNSEQQEAPSKVIDRSAEATLWKVALVVTLLVAGKWGCLFLLLVCLGVWRYYKPQSISEAISKIAEEPKQVKVVAGVVLGGFAGSFIGITAIGDGTAGTFPVAALMGYLVHVNTKEDNRN